MGDHFKVNKKPVLALTNDEVSITFIYCSVTWAARGKDAATYLNCKFLEIVYRSCRIQISATATWRVYGLIRAFIALTPGKDEISGLT